MIQSGYIFENTLSWDILKTWWNYYGLLKNLARNGYSKVTRIDRFDGPSDRFTVIQWINCGRETIDINSRVYQDTTNIIDVQQDWKFLNLYIDHNSSIQKISCDMTTYNQNKTIPISDVSILDPDDLEVDLDTYNFVHTATLYDMVERLWYDRKTIRHDLAQQAGISNYIWTRAQNLIIKNYLLSHITPDTPRQFTPPVDITVSPSVQKQLNQTHLWLLVNQWDYVWQLDRVDLAWYFGIDKSNYFGNKTQNLFIRQNLLNKIIIN